MRFRWGPIGAERSDTGRTAKPAVGNGSPDADTEPLAVGRVSLLAIDQVLSSISNLLVGLLAIRSLGLDEFGTFSVIYVSYTLVLGFTRAAFADPYMAGVFAEDEERDRHVVVVVFLLTGLGFGLVTGLALAVLNMATGVVAAVLVVTLTGVFVLDAVRYVGFKAPAPIAACAADGSWVVSLLAAIVVVDVNLSVAGVLLVWAAAGSFSLVVAIPFLPSRMVRLAGLSGTRTHGRVRASYAVDYSLSSGVGQLASIALGPMFGLAALGAFRTVSLVLRPATTIATAVQSLLLNEFALFSKRGTGGITRFAGLIGVGLVASNVAWAAIVLVLPQRWMIDLIGPAWALVETLLLPVVVLNVGLVAVVPAQMLLRYRQHLSRLLGARVFASALLLGGLVAGDVVAGIRAATWGMALGAICGAFAFWLAVLLPVGDQNRQKKGGATALAQHGSVEGSESDAHDH